MNDKEFITSALKTIGEDLTSYEILTDRRTATVFKIECDGGRVLALKRSRRGNDFGPYDPIQGLRNEIGALKLLHGRGSAELVGYGEFQNTVWMLTAWINGTSCSTFFDNKQDGKMTNLLSLTFNKIKSQLLEMQQVGLLHGDLQPAHIFIDRNKNIVFADFGISQYKNNHTNYKGCLVHFNSPYVAREMLNKNENIPYNSSDEMYSFLASCLFLVTKELPVSYSGNIEEMELNDMLQDIVDRKLPEVSINKGLGHLSCKILELMRMWPETTWDEITFSD